MAKKSTTYYVCSECGQEALKWAGQCSNCKAWNTFKQLKIDTATSSATAQKAEVAKTYSYDDIDNKLLERININMPLTSEVLGGGIVRGSLLLFGGSPGVGKSTLLLSLVNKIDNKCLYVSGEESLHQVKDRASRLPRRNRNLQYLSETDIDVIATTVINGKPDIVVIDSIQTIFNPNYPSTAGSLVQVREAAMKLQGIAKKNDISMLIVGHVTKTGDIAGPKVLEHIVDGVFYIEQENEDIRLLRAAKNRFGSTQEVALLQISSTGITEIRNPESAFLAARDATLPGSVITAMVEGSRVILVEVQALVAPTVFGFPRRSAVGIHPQRLELLLAVIEKRAKISLRNYDVFVKATAGFAAKEANVDLAVAAALVSAFKNKAVDKKYCVFGEVGLLGEIVYPKDISLRTKTASGMGFTRTVKSKKLDRALREIGL